MARCEKCIHFDVCYLCEIDNEIRDSGENPNCLYFFPTADVVEVVRCKDCKFVSFAQPDGTIHCDAKTLTFHKPMDFCSYGERKE